MITNGLTPVFGSEPLSWGTFGVLFGPPGSRSVACLCPLGDALEIHAGLLQSTSREALCRPPCGALGGILSRPAPFCLFRGHKGEWTGGIPVLGYDVAAGGGKL